MTTFNMPADPSDDLAFAAAMADYFQRWNLAGGNRVSRADRAAGLRSLATNGGVIAA